MHHFSKEEIAHLKACEGQKIAEINYYEWLNRANPKADYAFIDKIECAFESGKTVVFAINNEDSGMKITTKYDFETEKRKIVREFGDVISIIKHPATALDIWLDAVGNPVQTIDTETMGEGELSRFVYLNFGEEKRVIFHHQEKGLLVEIHEEDI